MKTFEGIVIITEQLPVGHRGRAKLSPKTPLVSRLCLGQFLLSKLAIIPFIHSITTMTTTMSLQPPPFDSQPYWHTRFTHETSFEWLVPSQTFVSILLPILSPLPRQIRILHLGSGTSDLHNHFRAAGFSNVTNVDYEPLALKRGQELEKRAFGDVKMRYAAADVTDMPRVEELLGIEGRGKGKEAGFDMVIDKSTVDAVSCGGEEKLLAMTEGVRRCLKEDGVWISLSYSRWRFDVGGLGFDVQVLERIPVPKSKETEPDMWYWCYSLRPRT